MVKIPPDGLIAPAVFHDGVIMLFIRGAGLYNCGVGVFEPLGEIQSYESVQLVMAVVKRLLDLTGAVTDGIEHLTIHQRLTQLRKKYQK